MFGVKKAIDRMLLSKMIDCPSCNGTRHGGRYVGKRRRTDSSWKRLMMRDELLSGQTAVCQINAQSGRVPLKGAGAE